MTTQTIRQISMDVGAANVTSRRFVSMGNNGIIALTGAGADAIGVSMETSVIADGRDVIPVGLLDGAVLEVEAGAAVDVSSAVVPVMSDATGRVIAATATNAILGYAKTSAGAAGEFIQIVGLKTATLAL